MFRNLEAEQHRNALTDADVAEVLGITRTTYNAKKIRGNFTFAEIRKLLHLFHVSFEYLFETDGDTPAQAG